MSRDIRLRIGVNQGAALYPFLFVTLMDGILNDNLQCVKDSLWRTSEMNARRDIEDFGGLVNYVRLVATSQKRTHMAKDILT